MYALYDDQRRQLMTLAIMLVSGGFAILPLTVPPTTVAASAQSEHQAATLSIPDVPAKLQFPIIAVQKDPFVPDVASMQFQGELPATAATGSGVRQGDDIGIVLPPNAGAGDAAPVAGAPIVRGIVLGDTPQALIDLGTGVKVFGVGDRVGSDRITVIDSQGVTLSSGIRLKIVSPS